MRRFTMLASLLMVLCLQMAAQTWEDVKVGTSTRKPLTYVPKNVEKSPALVISLHGMNQDPEYQQNQTQWNALADTEGFIVTYPLGNNRMWDTGGMGDVKFVEAIMKDMELKHHVDKNRIYLSGFSMGSWLGYHCLETLGDQIAAFGPVSGVDIGKQPRANRMVPIMHIHGTGDDVFKYTGDPYHMAGGYPSIEEYVKKWAAYEGCDASNPQVIRPYPAGRNTANDTRTIYNNVNDDVEVNLISIDGKGHWHSDDPNAVYSTRELWNFFKQYKLDLPDNEDSSEAKGEVLFSDNWEDEVINVGEGVPAGWKRINSMNDGSRSDEKANGAANTGGARIKDFVAGGDFNTGFYLSARDFDQCKLSYGLYDGHRLHLIPGKYQLSFNSSYWNDGSENGAVTFDAGIAGLSDNKSVLLEQNLDSEGNLKENVNQVVKGSLAHFLNFTVEKEGDYELYFTMSSGWAAVILGNVKIRKADTSTGITENAINAFGNGHSMTYNLAGHRISAQTKGMVIEQTQLANGRKVSRKVIKK